MSGTFYVISFVYLDLFVENIANYHEVYPSVIAPILHLVKSIDSHQKSIRVLPEVIYIKLEHFSDLFILVSTDGLDYYLRVLSVVHEASTFAYKSKDLP